MNEPKYVVLLEETLKLHMHIHRCTVFDQDGAPCHRSKVATAFLKKNDTSVMDWPRQSPDLSAIENLWTIMKDKMCREPEASNQRSLGHWNYPGELVSSMPRRIQAVIDRK